MATENAEKRKSSPQFFELPPSTVDIQNKTELQELMIRASQPFKLTNAIRAIKGFCFIEHETITGPIGESAPPYVAIDSLDSLEGLKVKYEVQHQKLVETPSVVSDQGKDRSGK